MISLESLDEQIRDVILVNGGDINIADYPYIIKEAEEHGLSQAELARRVRKVFDSIDWRPYNEIEKRLEEFILKGSISDGEAEAIIKVSEESLQRSKVINYILGTIKRRGFRPREQNSFEYDSFKNKWMTEAAWEKYQREKIAVEWLGEEVHSITELGDACYRKPEDAKYFLRNTHFIVPNITLLTKSATKADEFSKIIENESNIDKRYLKVLYHLNPKLPFRLYHQEFESIHSMFAQTAMDYGAFMAAAESYGKGHIHIWIHETDPGTADKLTTDFDYNSFLKFLFSVDKKHPFYFASERFVSPEQLIQKACIDASYWPKLAELMANNQLRVWFDGIGKGEWARMYDTEIEQFINSGYHSEEDIQFAKTETLIRIIDPGVSAPRIVSDYKKIELLSVEGSHTLEKQIELQLQNTGFARAKIYLDTNIDGLSLSDHTATFFSQANVSRRSLSLRVKPLQILKNKIYNFNIIVETVYDKLTIPVELRVVFPKKAYYSYLVKYAVIGAIFFGFIRYLLSVMTATKSWLENQYGLGFESNVRVNGFMYFVLLVLFVAGLVGSYFLIKKAEKI